MANAAATYQDRQRAYIERLGAPLEGGRVIAISLSSDGFPIVIVQCKDGKERALFVQSDEECNGPGAIGVQELPPEESS